MTDLLLPLAFAAALVGVGQWISRFALGLVDVTALPPHIRTRVQWWSRHEHAVTAACVVVAVAAVMTELAR